MPARLVQVTLINNCDFPIRWLDDGRPHGFWQDPWFPSNLKNLKKGEQGTWRQESGGVMTGVEGWAKFMVDVPLVSNIGVQTEFITLGWNRPFSGFFSRNIEHTRSPPPGNDLRNLPPSRIQITDVGFDNLGTDESILSQIALGGAFVPVTIPVVMANDMALNHVWWVVKVTNGAQSSTFPLHSAPSGVVYAINDAKDLLWYRHDGRGDGTFRWAFNEGKKVGNGWSVKYVFSGGDGVIYAINDANDLLWYRHDGRGDGTFRWAFNEGKKVGNGWSVKHVFSGGDGVIYAINDANDLLWYRHDGRGDGTFRWAFNEGKKVGNGWSVKHVFSGGDGVIYAINDANDLLWYRHDGRGDGTFRWAFNEGKKVGNGWSVKQVFSGG
jgi:Tachylectin